MSIDYSDMAFPKPVVGPISWVASPPSAHIAFHPRNMLVEVSGTAPESKTSIMYNIYYHSLATFILYNVILIFQEKI